MLSLSFRIFAYFKHKRTLHKYIYKMNRAYLRHLGDLEKFEISFQYVDQSANVNRQFNLCRQSSESITAFTNRVATNVDKAIRKKKKNVSLPPVTVSLSVDGNEIADEMILCKDVFTEDAPKEVVLNICDQSFKVIVNSPWISSMSLPNSILADFLVYPTKFETMYAEKHLCEFAWFKSDNKNDWTPVGDSFVYRTKNSEVGQFLKVTCLPRSADFEGPKAETISSVHVEAGPGLCPFEMRHQFTKEKCKGNVFRVVSYNILADLYCDSDFTREELFPYCPAYALTIDYRKQLIIKEVTGYNADIICLQEVDKKVYVNDLQPLLNQLGYDSDFCLKKDPVAEGLACFFNSSRFQLVDRFRLVLGDELNTNQLFSDIWEKIAINTELSERILNRSTTLQVTTLESLHNNELLLVANTHLYFHPDSDHIRLLQGAITIRYLEYLVGLVKNASEKRISVIFCGDFNSVPECGIYQLFTTGHVQEDHVDLRSNIQQSVQVPLQQSLQLRSACGTPKYTNFTAGFADCLDYIYYEDPNFTVEQVIPFPTLEELNQHTALPSVVFPSDHVAIIADLKWTL